MKKRQGNSLIEVLLAVGIASIVVATVGTLIISVNRVDRLSAHRDQAVGYAREALEITSAIASQEFSRTSGCTKAPGYNSCWVACPIQEPSCTATTVYQLIISDGAWHLKAGTIALGTNPVFTRSITLAPVNGDQNVKQVTAKVEWTEKNQTRDVELQTIVTGWKNVP